MIHFHHKQNGFSLVETLVAISILLIVITVPMAISSKTAKSSTFATEQIQVFFLAQEGIELAQKARNELQLQNIHNPVGFDDPWSKFKQNSGGIYSACFGPSGCGLEWDFANNGKLKTPVSCSGVNSPCLLRQRPNNSERSWFTHTAAGNTPTPFTRRVYFSIPSGAEEREVMVRSVVTWRTGSLIAEQKVEIETYLFNTYDNN